MITLSDGQRVQRFDEREVVRRRLLEEQGWDVVADDFEPPVEEKKEPADDMETRILDGVEVLAPEAVSAAKKRKPSERGSDSPAIN